MAFTCIASDMLTQKSSLDNLPNKDAVYAQHDLSQDVTLRNPSNSFNPCWKDLGLIHCMLHELIFVEDAKNWMKKPVRSSLSGSARYITTQKRRILAFDVCAKLTLCIKACNGVRVLEIHETRASARGWTGLRTEHDTWWHEWGRKTSGSENVGRGTWQNQAHVKTWSVGCQSRFSTFQIRWHTRLGNKVAVVL